MYKQTFSPALLVPSLVFFILCSSLFQSSPSLAVSSTSSGKNVRSFPPEVIVQRARQWVKAEVPYSMDTNPAYRYQNYRADCSGLVTMAWGIPATLPNYGLSTGTLSLVADLLGKALDASGTPDMSTMNKLQPGDILLNQGTDAHVILFVGWIDVGAKQLVNHPVLNNDGNYYYNGIEENGSAGKHGIGNGRGQAIEHTPDHPLHSDPFDYNQPWPYPYYPGYNSAGYYAWRFNATKAANLNLSPNPSLQPGGLWVTPKNGDSVTDVIHFAAQAYPTHQGDPAIFRVYFTFNSNGSWMVACAVSPPATGNVFACNVNPKDLGISYGQLQVSFDVVDLGGNVNLAPNGVHSLMYIPTPGPAPTRQPNFSQFVGGWNAHSRYITINKDGIGVYAGRTFAICGQYPPPCDNPPQGGMNTTIRFTDVSGLTIVGIITSGTGVRSFTTPNTVITVGSQITFTLQPDVLGHYTLLAGSDGWLGCYFVNGSTTVPPNDPHYANDCNSGA